MKVTNVVTALVLATMMFSCREEQLSHMRESCMALEIERPDTEIRCFVLMCDQPHYETLSCVHSAETVK